MDEKFEMLLAMMKEMKAGQDEMKAGQDEMKAGQEEMKAGLEKEMEAGQEEMKVGQEEIKVRQEEMKAGTEKKMESGQERMEQVQEEIKDLIRARKEEMRSHVARQVEGIKDHFDGCIERMEEEVQGVKGEIEEVKTEVQEKMSYLERIPNNFPANPEFMYSRPTVKPLTIDGQTSRTIFKTQFDVVRLSSEACLVYLDDIIIVGRTFEEHLNNLRKLFQRLQKANLNLNPKKCRFFQKEVAYLGHVISEEGVKTDPEKIKAIVDWPRSDKLHDLRSFLVLCTYYRRFV
ncbi:Retrovirus-related Pol polyprotein from transposon 297 [Araneus ventricosus]|uniref:Retrovirus-related Pol polyprotein from transposon 297 n=1 Tax=Araneus ventricosus TaxID=182803 RepID=A0A4Y2JM42_ARAVE|nr:Retrovirus-related Pol polyprotein from transposon 297 [Araneus ventricosus]